MIDHLPLASTPMLVSTINCLLRDKEFDNLADICSFYEVEQAEIERILADGGFAYSEDLNKIV